MKRFRPAIATLLFVAAVLPAQTPRRREVRREAAVPADAVSVDSIVAALYASVSHTPETSPDSV